MTSFAALAATLVLGICTPARADLEIWVSTTGTPGPANKQPVVAIPGGVVLDSTIPGWNLGVLSTGSNSPGTMALSFLNGASLSVSRTGAGTGTIYITLGDAGFTKPTAPPGYIQVDSSVGGSVTVPNNADALVLQSYIDPANGQNGLTGFTPGSQTPGITGTPVQSFSNSILSTIGHLTTTYSVTEFLKITLGAGSAFNFSSGTTVSLVPEPSSMAIAGLGMLGMIGYGIRRRRID
jgi:hypothetical protein